MRRSKPGDVLLVSVTGEFVTDVFQPGEASLDHTVRGSGFHPHRVGDGRGPDADLPGRELPTFHLHLFWRAHLQVDGEDASRAGVDVLVRNFITITQVNSAY